MINVLASALSKYLRREYHNVEMIYIKYELVCFSCFTHGSANQIDSCQADTSVTLHIEELHISIFAAILCTHKGI